MTHHIGNSSTEEPYPDHTFARGILGKNFHGLGAAEAYLGPWKPGEREARIPLRLRNHRTGQFLGAERTLQVLAECKGTHILVATRDVSLSDLYAMYSAGFLPPSPPWFDSPGHAWAHEKILDPWILVRQAILPDSLHLTLSEQVSLLEREVPAERPLLPVEFCYAAHLRLLETREKIYEDGWIRFPVRTAQGDCVGAHWDRIWLRTYSSLGEVPVGFVGLGTVRTW